MDAAPNPNVVCRFAECQDAASSPQRSAREDLASQLQVITRASNEVPHEDSQSRRGRGLPLVESN